MRGQSGGNELPSPPRKRRKVGVGVQGKGRSQLMGVRPYTGEKGERLYQSMKKTPIEMGRSEVHANTAKVCNLRSRGTTNGTNLARGRGVSRCFMIDRTQCTDR